MTSPFTGATLGDIVADDYRAATVLDRYALEYGCQGRLTLEEACRRRAINCATVAAALAALPVAGPHDERGPDRSWSASRLTAYIVERHHAYVRDALPSIASHLERVVATHGDRHPELLRIADRLARVERELRQHLMKEEELLFPYIRAVEAAVEGRRPPPSDLFGTVQNPIRMMESEHRSADNEMALIRELTQGFALPSDASSSYRACFAELAAFEADLRRHIHLENNLLFPKALALEETLHDGSPAQ